MLNLAADGQQEAPQVARKPRTASLTPRFTTEGMIRLRRRYDFASRSRPNAIAIVDPATNEVLYPGSLKIADEEKPMEPEGGEAVAAAVKVEPIQDKFVAPVQEYRKFCYFWGDFISYGTLVEQTKFVKGRSFFKS